MRHRIVRLREAARRAGEAGMTTAEYAVGTVAACSKSTSRWQRLAGHRADLIDKMGADRGCSVESSRREGDDHASTHEPERPDADESSRAAVAGDCCTDR